MLLEEDPVQASYGQINQKWDDLARKLGGPSGKSIRQHLDLVIKQHVQVDAAKRRKSGSSESLSRYTMLLNEVMQNRDYYENKEEYAKEIQESMRLSCATLAEKKRTDTPQKKGRNTDKAKHLNELQQRFEEYAQAKKEERADKARARSELREEFVKYRKQKTKYLRKILRHLEANK